MVGPMNRYRFLAAAALATFLITPGAWQTRNLTFRGRVEAQGAIERVYYSHQTDATLPFDEAVPPDLRLNIDYLAIQTTP
jgi:hypothetical protein